MDDEIKPPIVFLIDDGARVFRSVREAEQWLEAADVRKHPEWRGYDSNCRLVKPEIISQEDRILGVKTTKEAVQIRLIGLGNLEGDGWAREVMVEHLKRSHPHGDVESLLQGRAEDLLKRILGQNQQR